MVYLIGALWLFLCLFVDPIKSMDSTIHWKTHCNTVADNTEPRFHIRFEEDVYQTLLKIKFNTVIFDDFKVTKDGVFVFLSCMQLESMGTHGNLGTIIETAQPFGQKLKNQYNALPEGYSDLSEIEQFLKDIEQKHPDIASVVDMTQYNPGKTFEGRSFPVIKISDNVRMSENEPRILINGMHHAREIVTPVICMDIITRLTSSYKNNTAAVRSIVDSYEIFIAPVWNPDGYSYVWTNDNMWRKNRKPNTDGTYGVDQNRNYDLAWDGPCGGSTTPSSSTYRGRSAGSEEETQTMVDFSLKNNVAKVMDFHSSGREVLIGYRCEPLADLIDGFVTNEGTILAGLAQYRTRDPSADGEHQEWQIAKTTSYSFLTETATTFQPSFEDAEEEAKRVWPLVQAFLERPISLSGIVTAEGKEEGSSPIQADILIRGVANITRFSNVAQNGLYHLFLPIGEHEITFSADPYLPQTIEVSIHSNLDSLTRDVVLILPPK